MKPRILAIISPNGANSPTGVLGNDGGSAPDGSTAIDVPSRLGSCPKCKQQARQHVDHTPGAMRGWYSCGCPGGPIMPLQRRRQAEGT